MNSGRVLRFGAYAVCVLLAACGGTAATVKPAPPAPKAEPAPEPPPPEPSAFERKWSSASTDGLVGRCPAPFAKPGVFVDVGDSEQVAPPFCGTLDAQDGAAVR